MKAPTEFLNLSLLSSSTRPECYFILFSPFNFIGWITFASPYFSISSLICCLNLQLFLRAMSLFQSLLLATFCSQGSHSALFPSTDGVEVVVFCDVGVFSESLASLGLALVLPELTSYYPSVKSTDCCA